jgi:excisionase family DNA binding protein
MTTGKARTPVNDGILTIPEVAVHLRCSRAHVYNTIAGKVIGVSPLPVITMGRRKLIRRATLEEWERENEYAAGNAMLPASPDVGAGRRIERIKP